MYITVIKTKDILWHSFNFATPDIDECLSEPCQNGGTCINGENEYSCSCIAGWQGDNCETSKTSFNFQEILFLARVSASL